MANQTEKKWAPTKPGIEMTVRINNPSIAGRLSYNSEKFNSTLYFLMAGLPTTKLPNEVIQKCKNNISEAISTMGKSIRDRVEKLNGAITAKGILIPVRENSPGKVVKYVSNSRSYSELVANIDLIDQAIWILDCLSIALLISEEKKIAHEQEFKNLMTATESVISIEYKRVMGLLKANGKVNEVAVAMPVDKDVIPDLLTHPLIEIDAIHKVKNDLVIVSHPVRSYADKKPSESVESDQAPTVEVE